MKIIFNFILLLLLSFNAHSGQSTTVRLNNEIRDAHRSSGIAVTFKEWKNESSAVMSYGISANTLKSNLDLESSGRNRIYPVYMFIGASLNYPISPFIELGADLGDLIADKAFEGDGTDVDAYYSLGMTFTYKKKIDVSLYYKIYDLYFNELDDPTLQNVSLDVAGISVSFYIK